MRADSIREHLRAAPFQPFRVFLSDGSVHDVPHPDFAFVSTSHFLIVKDVNRAGTPRRTVMCDPVHVTRIEPQSGEGNGL